MSQQSFVVLFETLFIMARFAQCQKWSIPHTPLTSLRVRWGISHTARCWRSNWEWLLSHAEVLPAKRKEVLERNLFRGFCCTVFPLQGVDKRKNMWRTCKTNYHYMLLGAECSHRCSSVHFILFLFLLVICTSTVAFSTLMGRFAQTLVML